MDCLPKQMLKSSASVWSVAGGLTQPNSGGVFANRAWPPQAPLGIAFVQCRIYTCT